jgi:hypothetical protein
MRITFVVVVVVGSLALACAPPGPGARKQAPLTPLPALTHVVTTLDKTLVPAHPPTPGELNPAIPENTQAYLDAGLGDLNDGPGEPITVRTLDGSAAPARGPNAHRLTRFVHLADIQLMDDESPMRTADFDSQSVTSAIRPHDPFLCLMLNAAVRTINGLNDADPVDFVLLGGDIADSAQTNEVQWAMAILDGSPDVHCDSGDDNDIDPHGPDGKDHFAAAGLAMPWHWVSGNHDALVQGTFGIDPSQQSTSVGGFAQLGTRVYAGGGFGIIADGDVVTPDARRKVLTGDALIDLVQHDGDGHGLKNADASAGKAFHSFDVPGSPITFLALDTNHAVGGAEGVLKQSDVDKFVTPVLDDAKARNRVVVIASHHAVDALSSDGGLLGQAEADALLPNDWLAYLGGYPNVLFSMVGHAHRNQVRKQVTPSHPYWEVMTAALADFPHQFRVVEIWDDDNGTLRLETSVVDYAVDDDAPAARGRALGLIDLLSGWQGNDGRGQVTDRNVALIIPKP